MQAEINQPDPEQKEIKPNYDLLQLAQRIIQHNQEKLTTTPEKTRLDENKEFVLEAIQDNNTLEGDPEMLISAVLTIESEAQRLGQEFRTVEIARIVAKAFIESLAIAEQSQDRDKQVLVRAPFQAISRAFGKIGVIFFEQSFGIHEKLIKSGDNIDLTPEELQQLVSGGIFETMMQTYPTESQFYKVLVLPMIGSFQSRPVVLAPGRIFSQQ